MTNKAYFTCRNCGYDGFALVVGERDPYISDRDLACRRCHAVYQVKELNIAEETATRRTLLPHEFSSTVVLPVQIV